VEKIVTTCDRFRYVDIVRSTRSQFASSSQVRLYIVFECIKCRPLRSITLQSGESVSVMRPPSIKSG